MTQPALPPPADPMPGRGVHRAGGWGGAWGLVLLLLIVLLGTCAYQMAKHGGFHQALEDEQFQFWAIVTFLIAFVVAMRVGMRRVRAGIEVDAQSHKAMQSMGRSYWFRVR